MEGVGIRVCRMLSSPITIAMKRVWRWCHLRCSTDGGVELRCFGARLENGRFSDPMYCKKLRSKFVWWERTCELRSQGRRATPIIGEESWVLKLEIFCTSMCHLWEVCAILRYEASLQQGSLDHSRFWRRKVNWITNWSCHHSCLMYMTFCMSLNWRNVCVCLKSKSPWKIWMLEKISHIKSTLSWFWRRLKELHETRRSRCARSNGVTIPRKRPHGKEKKSWRQSSQVSFPIRLNLRDEIHFMGGRFVPPCFSQTNKTLGIIYSSK
jgi:hypothetical protein